MQVKFLSYTGNGSSQSITGVGFQPDLVIVKRTNGVDTAIFKTPAMGSTNSLPLRDDLGFIASGAINSLDANGFSVGADSRANGNTMTYLAICVKDDGAGDFKTFSYTGTGVDNRTVTGLGFAPVFACVKGNVTSTGAYRMSGMPANTSDVFYGGGSQTWIRSLDADGITVDASNFSNQNTIVYYGFAFKSIVNKAAVVSYTGNATNRNITTVGFRPGWVWVKDRTNNIPNFATINNAAGQSQGFDTSQIATGVTAFLSNGFSLGTDVSANANADTFDAFCLYDPAFYAGPPNYALQFDGSQNYLSLGTLGNFGSQLGSGVYMDFKIQTTEGDTSFRGFGMQNSNTTTKLHIFFNRDSSFGAASGKILLQFNDEANNSIVAATTSATNYNDGKKHRIVIIGKANPATVTIIIDGIVQPVTYSSQTTLTTFANLSFPFLVGATSEAGVVANFMDCTVDDFKIGTSPTNLYAFLPMNEGTGTKAADISGSNNNGTLTGSPLPLWVAGLIMRQQLATTGVGK